MRHFATRVTPFTLENVSLPQTSVISPKKRLYAKKN